MNEFNLIEEINLLIDNKKIKEAKLLLSKNTSIVNKNAHLLALKGFCFYQENNFKKAALFFSKALEIKPDSPTTLYFRAQCYEKLEMLNNALLDYEKSNLLKPSEDCKLNINLILKYQNNH